MIKAIKRKLNNRTQRDEFVRRQLRQLRDGSKLLDAGAGSQAYRPYCSHLRYFAQDFSQYRADEKPGFADQMGAGSGYAYGRMDYVGDIWSIAEQDGFFDAILCTEVFEHIPYPIQTVREFSRLLRPGGTLILTAPSNCLRHMDPYFFYTGFSDRFYERILGEHGFSIRELYPVGDYYRWLGVEMARTAATHSVFAKALLLPGCLYYLAKKSTAKSVNTLCMGYHVVAVKKT